MTKMTAAQAIDILDGLKTNWVEGGLPDVALDMAIAALKQEPIEGLRDAIDAANEMIAVQVASGIPDSHPTDRNGLDFISWGQFQLLRNAARKQLELTDGSTPASNSQLP